MPETVTRFAPSPTGLLHLGNARTALFSWLFARADGGRVLLRIEDTDHMRSSAAWLKAQLIDLEWLGLDWDGTPAYQSERDAEYAERMQQLQDSGNAYPCFCSAEKLSRMRKQQAATGRPPRYDGTCAALDEVEAERRVADGEPHVLRFRIPAKRRIRFDDLVHGAQDFDAAAIGDFVIRRSNGSPAFFFCNALDDAESGVTVVLRGEDHLSNTPRQLLLLEALGLEPPAYGHLPLLLTGEGVPMSKRDSAAAPLSERTAPFSLRHFRDRGYHPRALVNYIARLGCTWPHDECKPLTQLAQDFDPARLGRAPARFDEDQLHHWQRLALDGLDPADWWAWAGEETAATVPESARAAFIETVRPNVLFPGDALYWALACHTDTNAYNHAAMETIAATPASFFAAAESALAGHGTDFKAFTAALTEATGQAGKALYAPLRAALTGRLDGPGLAELLALMGGERALERLARARESAAR